MVFYSCNLRGECEEDEQGLYLSIEECKASCNPSADREVEDLSRIIASYDEDKALELAPSDRIVLVKMLTGIKVSAQDSYRMLSAYYTNDYMEIYRYDEGPTYLRETVKLMPLYFLILDFHNYIIDRSEYRIIDAILATDWIRHVTTAHRALTRLVRGADFELRDDPPEDDQRILSHITYMLLSRVYEPEVYRRDELYNWVRENALPVITELYGVIPAY